MYPHLRLKMSAIITQQVVFFCASLSKTYQRGRMRKRISLSNIQQRWAGQKKIKVTPLFSVLYRHLLVDKKFTY
jgi:hypothetical protein